MKKILLLCIIPIKIIFSVIIKALCVLSVSITGALYHILFLVEWRLPGKNPVCFDHNIDLYYKWKKTGNIEWLSRGVFSTYAINLFDTPQILELGCGDGFNTKYFYAQGKSEVLACDNNESAIRTANKKHKKKNVTYIQNDFYENMPCKNEKLTNVIWDASINFFDLEQINFLLNKISNMLFGMNGILSGVAVAGSEEQGKWEYYKHLFTDGNALKNILEKHFSNVIVYEYGSQLYFYASNGKLPFMNI